MSRQFRRTAAVLAPLVAVGLMQLAAPAQAAPVGSITVFSSGIPANAQPNGITLGPDGALWFAATDDAIGRITTSGSVTMFTQGITSGASPTDITLGPDGNLWFTESTRDAIGRITPSGVVTEFTTGITTGGWPTGITAGPDGKLWFAEQFAGKVAKITTSGTVTEYTVGGAPLFLTSAAGYLWVTDSTDDRVVRVSTTGGVQSFGDGAGGFTAGAGLTDIVSDGAGGFWVTEQTTDKVARMTAAGAVTEVGVPGTPMGLTRVPDGTVWVADRDGGLIRVTPAGGVKEYTSGLLASASIFGVALKGGNVWFTDLENDAIGRAVAVAPPVARLTAPKSGTSLVLNGSVTVRWAATSAVSVSSYDVRWHRARYDGGFGAWKKITTSSTSRSFALDPGYDSCYAVRARDSLGQIGPWSGVRCVSRAADDRVLAADTSWIRASGKAFYRHTVTRSSSKGAALRLGGVTAKRLGIVATTCPGCGTVRITIAGSPVAKFDLSSATTRHRVLKTKTLAALSSGKVVVKILSIGRKVEIDGLVVSRT